MSTSASVFSLAHIALTAAITVGVALLVLVVLRTRFKTLPLLDCLLVALVAGLSVLVWRSAGNTGALNNDPIPAVSPNDVCWKDHKFATFDALNRQFIELD